MHKCIELERVVVVLSRNVKISDSKVHLRCTENVEPVYSIVHGCSIALLFLNKIGSFS